MTTLVRVNPENPNGRVVGYFVHPSGCWEWVGAKNAAGYGIWRGRMAHRRLYERCVGPVPDDKELDHLCRKRDCVNPDHLEPVSHKENILRGDTWGAVNAKKTHCPQGHEYTPENMRLRKGSRECRICTRVRQRHV